VHNESLGLPEKALEAECSNMHALVRKYTADFPRHRSNASVHAPEGDIALITGTTGALGCNLLAQLLMNPEIVRVYAVNRAQKGGISLRTKQASALKERGLDPKLVDSSKLVVLEADTTTQDLGISKEIFEEVSACPSIFEFGLIT
jgi:hypothetical protein